jgi:aminoglycoside phosphotransferase (APT) family kinase protein
VLICNSLVEALLHSQFPDLAELHLGARHEGWDNVTIRLGDSLAVRLPRRTLGATLFATELEWLPRISAKWTFPVPLPVRIGAPEAGYPWRWSVVKWPEGTIACDAPLSADGARDLGQALAQVHSAAPHDAPRNPYRSTPLVTRAERLNLRLEALVARFGDAVHPDVARAVYRHGALQEPGPITWAHLDIHGRNVITQRGRLSGILDWGDAAAGDPAADLGQALTLVGDELFDDLAHSYADAGGAGAVGGALSEATLARIRAEAVAYATLLAGIDEASLAAAGWAALEAFGVADDKPSAC